MGNVHHGLFTVIARHSTQNGQRNLSGDLPLSIYLHELTKDCKVTSVQSMKIYRDSRGRAPPILKLGTRCEWNFNVPAVLSPEKKTRKPMNTRLGEPQRMSVRLREKKYYMLHCSRDTDYTGKSHTLFLYHRTEQKNCFWFPCGIPRRLFSAHKYNLVAHFSVYATNSCFANMESLKRDKIKSAELQSQTKPIVLYIWRQLTFSNVACTTVNAAATFINTLQFILSDIMSRRFITSQTFPVLLTSLLTYPTFIYAKYKNPASTSLTTYPAPLQRPMGCCWGQRCTNPGHLVARATNFCTNSVGP
jgi:hypothetical protein